MFEDKRYSSDNLNKNRFFIPEDNTGLKKGNDNLSLEEDERRYVSPPPPNPIRPKKKEKSFKGLAFVLAVIIILLVIIITTIAVMNIFSSPYKIYTRFLNEGYNILENELRIAETKKLNYDMEEDTITSAGSFNMSTNMPGINAFNDYNYDYKISVNNKKSEIDGTVNFKKGNTPFVNLNAYLRDNKFYLLESSIYNGLLEMGSSEAELPKINLNYDYNDLLNVIKCFKDTILENLNEDNLSKKKDIVKINNKNVKVTNNVLTLKNKEIRTEAINLIEALLDDANALKSLSSLANMSRKDMIDMLKELKNDEDFLREAGELKVNIYAEGLANNFVGFKVIIDKVEAVSFINEENGYIFDVKVGDLALSIKIDGNKKNVSLDYDEVKVLNVDFTSEEDDKTKVEFDLNFENEEEEEYKASGSATYVLKRIGDKRQTFKLSGKAETNFNKKKYTFKLELNNTTQVGGKMASIDVDKAKHMNNLTVPEIKTIDRNVEKVLYKSPLLNLYKDTFSEAIENKYNCDKSYDCVCNSEDCTCKYLNKDKIEEKIVCPV